MYIIKYIIVPLAARRGPAHLDAGEAVVGEGEPAQVGQLVETGELAQPHPTHAHARHLVDRGR